MLTALDSFDFKRHHRCCSGLNVDGSKHPVKVAAIQFPHFAVTDKHAA